MVERIEQVESSKISGYWRGLMVVALVLGIAWINLSRLPQEVVAQDQAIQAPMIGFLAPDFSLQFVDGGEFQLSTRRGLPLIINFWATWCPPCRAEMPALESIQQQYASQGLMVLGVDQGESPEVVTQFARQTVKTTFPLVLDRQMQVGQLYGVRALPTTFFVDREGRIRSIKIGALDTASLVDGVQQIMKP